MGFSVGNRLFCILHGLIIAARTAGGLVHPRSKTSTKVIDNFDRAVNVEALRRIQETGEDLFLAMVGSQVVRVKQDILLWRFKYVETSSSYDHAFRGMDGTREFLLKRLIGSATKQQWQKEESNTYWVYGLPGRIRTSLAHSICRAGTGGGYHGSAKMDWKFITKMFILN